MPPMQLKADAAFHWFRFLLKARVFREVQFKHRSELAPRLLRAEIEARVKRGVEINLAVESLVFEEPTGERLWVGGQDAK